MFINCPNCNALVATDLVTDQPPPRCPRCDYGLRDTEAPLPAAPAADAAAGTEVPSLSPDPFRLLTPPPPVASPPLQDPAATVRFVPLHEPLRSEAVAPPPVLVPTPEPGAADDTHGGAHAASPPDAVPPPLQQDDREPADNIAPAPDAASAASAPVDRTTTRGAPSFLRAGSPINETVSPRERRVLRIAIPALAVLLLLQLLLADRVRLAADATWRPWVATACALARCTLPPWHAPEAIVLVQRDVRPHAAQHGVLQVSATLRNDAQHPQAWPMLLLTLSDVDGRPLGARWFTPAEYRPADAAADTLPPGASAAFRIDVVEPSPHTVAFNFAFG